MEILLTNYIIFSLYLVFLIIGKHYLNVDDRTNKVFITISFLVLLFIHCGVNVKSVEDLPSYQDDFYLFSSISLDKLFKSYRTTEYAYLGLSKIVSSIHCDFRLFLVVYNVILMSSYYLTFKKYSRYIPLSIIMFLLIVFNQSIFVLRQHLAIAILLLSIPTIVNRKLILYLIIVAVAFYIHHSALFWIPIYFISNIKKTHNYIITLIISTFFFISLTAKLGDYIMMIDLDYSRYLQENSEVSRSLTKTIIQLVYFLTYVITLRKDVFKIGINRIITTMLFILTVGYIFAPSISLLDRVMQYYQTILLFSVPLTMSYFNNNMKCFIYVFAIVVFQGYTSLEVLNEYYYYNFSLISIPIVYVILLLAVTIYMVKYKFLQSSKKTFV